MRHLALFVLGTLVLVAVAGCQSEKEPIAAGSIVAEGNVVSTPQGAKFATREFSHMVAGKFYFDLYDAAPGASERIELKPYVNKRMRISTTGPKGDALGNVRILKTWDSAGEGQ